MYFGMENKSISDPKSENKSTLTSKGIFGKIVLSLQRGLEKSGSGDASYEKKRRKTDPKMKSGREGIWVSIFVSFLIVFGSIFGGELVGKGKQK